MKKKGISSAKKFIFFSTLALSALPCSALSLVDADSKLAKIFSFTEDENAASTSYRSLLIPSAGKAESLGCAFTGLCDDINFIEYNPAASSILTFTQASVAHNKWISDSALESVAITSRWKNFGLAAQIRCFYVPFAEYNIFGEKTSSSYYSETTAVLNASYNFLAGYTFKGLAAGINLKTSFRNVPDYADSITNALITGSGLAQSGLAFMADIGLLLRFNAFKIYSSREPNFIIGLSFFNAGAGLTGFGEKIILDDPLPTKINFGLSYRIIKPFVISAEIQQPVNLLNISQSEKTSFACGLNLKITDFFSASGGFLLKGANPRFSLGTEFYMQDIIINATYTLDLTSSANPVNRISLAAKMNLGDKGRIHIQKEIDKFYCQGLTYYAQSGLEKNYEEAQNYLDKALEAWQKVLQLDKTFDPAKNGIDIILAEKENLKKVQDAQSLNQ